VDTPACIAEAAWLGSTLEGFLQEADAEAGAGICVGYAGMQAAALTSAPLPPVQPAVGTVTNRSAGPAVTP
jgi:hypothetical protein